MAAATTGGLWSRPWIRKQRASTRWRTCNAMADVRATLDDTMALRLAEFARACKAALRAGSLYPGGHPPIGGAPRRLPEPTPALTGRGPVTPEVRPNTI